MVSKRDYLDWRSSHVTKALVKALNDKREFLKEGLAEGAGQPEDVGRCQALRDIIEYILRDFETFDEESVE